MIKTSELTGPLLSYWTAVADGIPREQLSLRKWPATGEVVCCQQIGAGFSFGSCIIVRYAESWGWAGPLIDKHELTLMRWKYEAGEKFGLGKDFWAVERPCISHYLDTYRSDWEDEPGDTAIEAICRAVVRESLGDEVEEIGVDID